MKSTIRAALVAGFLIASAASSVAANQAALPAPLSDALAELATNSGDWAYTRQTSGTDGDYVERFDPSLPRDKQWSLLEYAGAAPDESHLAYYREHYDELFDRESPAAAELHDVIKPGSVELVEQSDQVLIYRFAINADDADDEKFVKHLEGRITIARDVPSVQSVRIAARAPFKPAMTVKITEFSLAMEFATDLVSGQRFIVRTREKTQGRFMAVKRFDEEESVQFRDFSPR